MKKVSCLMATHARYNKVARALYCFLSQDYQDKELIILNNAGPELIFNHPQVKVINRSDMLPTLGDCRNELLTHATGEFIRTWDDDDIYLPWTLRQAVEHIRDEKAWKPKRSWFYQVKKKTAELQENNFEASILVRTEVAKQGGYESTIGDEHRPLLKVLGDVPNKEMGILSSYMYCWNDGGFHASGNMSGTVEERTRRWLRNNTDDQSGVLIPTRPTEAYEIYKNVSGVTVHDRQQV